jgi:hypothetical protein
MYDSVEVEDRMSFVDLVLVTALFGSFGSPENPANVRVLVLDALNGRPQANATVRYLCDQIPHSTNTHVQTDANGFALVPYTCESGSKIELSADTATVKEGCGSGVEATLEEIESTGVVAHPDSAGGIWCPTKISRKLTPVRGQVTLFVKKPTWWQSHIAG